MYNKEYWDIWQERYDEARRIRYDEARRIRYDEARRIRCPHCGKVQDNDDCQYPVSYHGEDSIQSWECDGEDCGKTFWVEERVTREYATAKTREACEGG